MRSVPGSPTFFERSFDRPRGSARPFAFQTLAMKRSLLIALISTDYPPLRTSAAVQLRDLAQQLAALGHRPIVIVPSPMSGTAWMVERIDGIEVLRVAAPRRGPAQLSRGHARHRLQHCGQEYSARRPQNLRLHRQYGHRPGHGYLHRPGAELAGARRYRVPVRRQRLGVCATGGRESLARIE